MSVDRTYLVPAGLALVLLLFGGALIGAGRLIAGAAEARRTWPSTEGVVTTNWKATEPTRVRDSKTGNTYEQWGAILEYTYEVDGRQYTGNGRGYGEAAPLEVEADYVVGEKVRVFYDPEDPSRAALTLGADEPEDIRTPFLWVGCGVMLLGAPFGYLSYRMARGRGGAAS